MVHYSIMCVTHKRIFLTAINATPKFNDEVAKQMTDILNNFKQTQTW